MISRLRSKKTWLSQSTYACIKVWAKRTKTAGEFKLTWNEKYLKIFFCDVMPLKAFGLLTTWWCFYLRQRWERTAHHLKSHIMSLCFGEYHHLIGQREISSHSIAACHGREGGGNTFSWLSARFPCASDERTLSAVVRGICCITVLLFDIDIWIC